LSYVEYVRFDITTVYADVIASKVKYRFTIIV